MTVDQERTHAQRNGRGNMVEPRQPFGSDFVFGLPAVGAPTVRSTDGAVAFVFTSDDAETLETSAHIELMPFESGSSRRLTAGTRDGAPRWSPDGSHLTEAVPITSEAHSRSRLYEVQVSPLYNGTTFTRNIILSDDTTLHDLHFSILAAVGGDARHRRGHLHMFIGVDGTEYRYRDLLDEMDVHDEGAVAVRELLHNASDSFRYFCDSGDGWDLGVTLIRAQDYPLGSIRSMCVAGTEYCPPEDCGGIGGYVRCLDAMSSPSGDYDHEQIAWVRIPEGAHVFNVSEANYSMRTLVRRDGRLAWPSDNLEWSITLDEAELPIKLGHVGEGGWLVPYIFYDVLDGADDMDRRVRAAAKAQGYVLGFGLITDGQREIVVVGGPGVAEICAARDDAIAAAVGWGNDSDDSDDMFDLITRSQEARDREAREARDREARDREARDREARDREARDRVRVGRLRRRCAPC